MTIFVDRSEFIAWIDGYALIRSRKNFVAPNDDLCERAERAIKRGHLVTLTVNGQPFSIIVKNVEKRISKR
jgi:hypothetical protein